MKKICLFFCVVFLLSCNSDDTEFSNPEFVDAVTGWYILTEIYTEEALDLNMNGEAHTELFQWNHYCNRATLFDSYRLQIVSKVTYTNFNFRLPFSHVDENLNQSYCITDGLSGNPLVIDELLEEVTKTESDHWDNFLLENFRAKFIDFKWEDGTVYITLEKEFYRADGVWVDAILHMKYEKL